MAVQPVHQLSMDTSQQQGFVRFFKSLPEKPATTIRFFNRVDYYTLHGSDAIFAAKEVFKTSSVVKQIGAGDNKLESVVLSKANFESFVRDLLLLKQYRVEVFTSKGGTRNASDWSLEYKGSPGNLVQFEDVLFSSQDQVVGSAVIAVKLSKDEKNKFVGVGFVETADHKFCVCEFPDDDHFTNLEALIVQLGPKECLIPQGDGSPEQAALKKVLDRSNILVTGRKKADFSTSNLASDLNRLLHFKSGQQQNSLALPEMNLSTATMALAAVIKYLELGNDEGNSAQFTLSSIDIKRYVHMDSAAVRALNLLPGPGSNSLTRHHSVLGLLDRCRTPQGHRLLAQWVKQPLRDLNAVNERHDIVQVLFESEELRQTLTEEHLRRIPDLQALAKKLQRKKGTMQDCYKIYQAVSRLPVMLDALKMQNEGAPHPTLRAAIIDPLRDYIGEMEKFQDMIESTLDMDVVDRGEFLVKPSFDENFQELRNQMDELEEKLKSHLNKAARDLSLEPGKSVKLESNSQLGYYFRVTLKDEKVLRNNKNFTTIDTNKNGVRFRDSKLEQLNSDYISTRDQYQEHQKAVVDEIMNIASGYSGTLNNLSGIVAHLDVLTSFAVVVATAPRPYTRPKMHAEGSGVLSLTQARHPCLERQDGVDYIPNDAHFKHGECTFHIITGPNMGGKSTYIRSVGVCVLLAQLGSYVPCDEAEISLVDAILARVGADDCQLKGMSTFMTEMVETAGILGTATKNSLVIIDELGRGTSTYEGCGIAWAIAEHLAKDVQAFCLFATHFHELTRLAGSLPNIRNSHVTAITTDDSLTLMYQVKEGVCDQSFGIHVAKMAKFPPHVIEYAKRKQAELEDYQGLDFASDDTTKSKIIEEAEEIMEDFLQKSKKICSEGAHENDAAKSLEKLREEVLAKDNAYIKTLLSQ